MKLVSAGLNKCAPNWEYKANKEPFSEATLDTMPKDLFHSKNDYIDVSILDTVSDPKHFSFGLYKLFGSKSFCEIETIPFR